MKKILISAGVALALMIPGLASAAIDWDTTGNYVVEFQLTGDPTPYDHDMTLAQDLADNVTGTGGYPAGFPFSYAWDITSGTVVGNIINLTILYDLGAPGTVMHMTGTIAPDGTMSGTWDDNFGGARTGTWLTKSGAATVVVPACNGSTFDDFTLGSVNGQDGWISTGPYDQEIVDNIYGYPTFGCKSLRISNAVTSGSFGDQTFSKPIVNEAGETDALNGGMSGGTRQNHFEAEFAFASTMADEQPGLFLSVSPDRGDGARMSYLGFDDEPGGINVIFYDVQSVTDPAVFSPTLVATGLSRTETHTAKFVIDFVDGPSNDIVKIYIDGVLVHTGTTWENYYRFDDESNPGLANPFSRTVDSLLFRAGGTAAPGTDGNGYIIDNLTLASSIPPPTTGTISGSKFWDVNGNGAWNAGEPGLGNWTINADNSGGSQVTSGTGAYSFATLLPNTYTLTETLKPGWTQTKAPAPISLAAGQNVTNADFGNSCFVTTGGHGKGFWTNKNGKALMNDGNSSVNELTLLTTYNLRNANGTDFDPGTYAAYSTWNTNATAVNMAYMLSAQLSALVLSVEATPAMGTKQIVITYPALASIPGMSPLGVITINALIAAANTELGLHGNTTTPNAFRAYQEALKNAVEKAAEGTIALCQPLVALMTFTASDSLYYNGPTAGDGLYGTGPITFTWDPATGNVVAGGLWEEIVPPTSGTHYFNNIISGTVTGGGAVNLTLLRTVPDAYGPFTIDGTLVGNTLTGTAAGPYLFTATGTITP